MICLDLLNYWDENRGSLEHFLTTSASNKLRVLIKSKSGSTDFVKEKKSNLERASDISMVDSNELPTYEDVDLLDHKLIFEKIENNLSISDRKNYLKLKMGGYLATQKRLDLIDNIRNAYVQDILPIAFCVNSIDDYCDKWELEISDIIPFSSGRLAFIDNGYLVEYI